MGGIANANDIKAARMVELLAIAVVLHAKTRW